MAIRSYNELYLPNAMGTIGTMLDYAVNYKSQNIDSFFEKFILSGIASKIESGDSAYITGKSGIDLVQIILNDYFDPYPTYVQFNRSPEYWLGWSLAYYQWYTNRSFREITLAVSLSEMLNWYPTLHETNVFRFVETLNSRFLNVKTNLENIRITRGLTQSMLSNLSGIDVRTIRSYESREKDINIAQIGILINLSRVLNCNVNDLLDRNNYQVASQNQAYNYEYFSQQLLQQLRFNEQRLANLNWQKQQLQAIIRQYQYGYMAQFPFSQNAICQNGIQVDRNIFMNNWTSYWNNAVASNQNAKVLITKEQIRKAGELALDITAKASGNKPLSVAFDVYKIVTANSLASALLRIGSIIYTLN